MILLSLLALLALATPDGKDLFIPPVFNMSGTFNVPYANISVPIAVHTDVEHKRQFINFYNGMGKSLLTSTTEYVERMKYDKPACESLNAFFDAVFAPMFPTLDKFTYVDQMEIDGIVCNHYSYNWTIEDASNDTRSWVDAVIDREDFYCIPLTPVDNKPFCQPKRWEMHGYNVVFGSHYSYYYIDYDSFDLQPNFTDEDFAVPESCATTTSSHLPSKRLDLTYLLRAVRNFDTQPVQKPEESSNVKLTFTTNEKSFHSINPEDFMKLHTGHIVSNRAHETFNYETIPEHTDTWYIDERTQLRVAFPMSLDWRLRGIISPIRDQAFCGSCWTFGAMGTVEGRLNAKRWFEGVRNKPPITLSEQSIVSCVWGEFLRGCNGGNSYLANEELLSRFGGKVVLRKTKPYLGMESRCDPGEFTEEVGTIKGVYKVASKDVGALKYALMKGPVQVAINTIFSFLDYAGGVYNDPRCTGERYDLKHSVLCIGWGVDEEYGEYWILRNSWSNAWGMDGYAYVAIEGNICGVTTDADYVTV